MGKSLFPEAIRQSLYEGRAMGVNLAVDIRFMQGRSFG